MLVDNSRRTVNVVNRGGLLEAAGESYGLADRHYHRLLDEYAPIDVRLVDLAPSRSAGRRLAAARPVTAG